MSDSDLDKNGEQETNQINEPETTNENSSNVETSEDLLNKLSKLRLKQQNEIIEKPSKKLSSKKKKEILQEISKHKDRISYLHINVNGLTTNTDNFEKLRNLVEERYENEIDIVCITEPNNPDIDIELDDYNLHHTFPKGPKGGAAVYVKKSSEKFSEVTKLENLEKQFRPCDHDCGSCLMALRYETVWIQFKRKRDDKMIVVGTIYRHPDKLAGRIKCFVNKLENALDREEFQGKLFYLLGDFNINLKKAESDGLLDMLRKLGYEPLIETEPTTTNGTLIDHIHTNDDPTANHLAGVDRFVVFNCHYPIYCIK